MAVLILSGYALVAVPRSSSHFHVSDKFDVVGEAQTSFVLHRGADCWQPCGEIGGHCPGFCGWVWPAVEEVQNLILLSVVR